MAPRLTAARTLTTANTANYQPVYLGDDQRPTLDYAELIERSLNGVDLTDYVECEARADENAGADQFLLFMAEDRCRVSVFSEVDEKTMIPAETMLITFELFDGSVCNFEGPGNNDLLSVPGLVSNIRATRVAHWIGS